MYCAFCNREVPARDHLLRCPHCQTVNLHRQSGQCSCCGRFTRLAEKPRVKTEEPIAEEPEETEEA